MSHESWTSRLPKMWENELPKWLTFPDYILAPSPEDPRIQVRFRLDPEYAVSSAADNRRTPAFELWSQVIGEPPRVINIRRQALGDPAAGLLSLRQSHACFSGIRRPIREDGGGECVLSYVTKPQYSFKSVVDMVTPAEKYAFPSDLVFIICVKLDTPYLDGSVIPEGVITHWGSAEADVNDPSLPADFERRFERRLW